MFKKADTEGSRKSGRLEKFIFLLNLLDSLKERGNSATMTPEEEQI